MDFDEYRVRGKEMVDYIADYLENIRLRRVFPDVKPGYMRPLIPSEAPHSGEKWDDIFSDVERVIMPGMTHWQSPHMHAYFPALNSPASLLGDMLADAIGCLGFTWASSPACTELETIVMDWLGKMIGLPTKFLHSNEQTMGGGVIQTTASEATFVSLLAARSEAIKRIKATHPDLSASDINGRLVAYCSDQAHSSVEKASLVGLVKLRLLPTDEDLSLRGDTLRAALLRDKKEGLIPFFLCATIGTTGACSFDNLIELGPICATEDVWLHIDAAYAGSAFICPEYRHFMEGAEYAQSFAFNPSKWLMVHFDCTAMWVENSGSLHRTFNVQPLYLRHENTGAAIDYMHWQVPLSRRFRSLKLWFVLRSYGISGLQKHIKEGVRLAEMFEDLVNKDPRFEIPAKRHLGLVVFRLKGDNDLTELLLKRLNQSGKIHAVPAAIKGKYIIRFTVTSMHTTNQDIERDWKIIRCVARQVLVDLGKDPTYPGMSEAEEEEELIGPQLSNIGMKRREGMKRHDYGMSLILSNVPMSPKFIDGSFAALFENTESIAEYARHLSRRSIDFNGQPIRLSPRKRFTQQSKQYSFDLSRHASNTNQESPNRGHLIQRQGSLDSKIEEIIDNSIESSSRCGSTQDTTGSGSETRRNGNHCDKADDNEEEEEEEEELEHAEETMLLFKRNKAIIVRASMVDKAVQSVPFDLPLAGRSETEVECILDSPSEGRAIVMARSASTLNGLTPLICKHCGTAVED